MNDKIRLWGGAFLGFENQIAIYDNKVAITSLNPDELIGVLIESSVYARTQRAVFNLSWLGATAFVAQ